MQTKTIAERINEFPRWHYQFELEGQLTPAFNDVMVNRQRERKRHFFDPMVELLGGSLRGKRVLDLGCNAGFWSLAAVEAGADFVFGVDGRQMHVDQSNFVFETKAVDRDRYRFDVGNVFDYDFAGEGPFDIVLCLGLLYHVAKPFTLIELISKVNTDVLLIDTAVSEIPGSFLSLAQEEPLEADPRRAVDYRLVTYPTKMAVRDIANQLGYEVAVLKPQPLDGTGVRDYLNGTSRSFVCAKQTELSRLTVPTEPFTLYTQTVDTVRWLRNRVTELIRPAGRTGIKA